MPSVIGEGSSPEFVIVRTDDGRTVELPASLVPGFGITPLQPAPDALLAPMSQRGPQVSAIPANEAQELWAENRPEPTGAPVNKRYDTPGPNGDPQPPSVWVADPPAPVPPSDPKYAFGQGAVTGASPAPTAPQRSPGGSGGYGGSQDGSNPFARPTADAKSAMADTQAQLRANQRKQDSLTTHYAVDNAGRMAEIEKKQADIKIQSEKDMLGLQEDLATLRSQKIDPNRFWNNLGTPGKISAVIGLFIGGYNEAKTGKNSPLATVMKLIDNDIAAQKEDINNAFQGFNAKQGLYQLNLKRWGDEVTAMQATRLAYLDQYKTELAALQGQFKSTYDIGRIGVEMAQADMKAAEMWEALKNRRQEVAIHAANAAGAERARQAAQQLAREQFDYGKQKDMREFLHKVNREHNDVLNDALKLAARQGKDGHTLAVVNPAIGGVERDKSGNPLQYKSKDDAKKGTESYIAATQLDQSARRFIELQQQFGITYGGLTIPGIRPNLIPGPDGRMRVSGFIDQNNKLIRDKGAEKAYDELLSSWADVKVYAKKIANTGATETGRESDFIQGMIGEGPYTITQHDATVRVLRFLANRNHAANIEHRGRVIALDGSKVSDPFKANYEQLAQEYGVKSASREQDEDYLNRNNANGTRPSVYMDRAANLPSLKY